MSSLTSLSVNKNSTRFAPKVKARPSRPTVQKAPPPPVAPVSEAETETKIEQVFPTPLPPPTHQPPPPIIVPESRQNIIHTSSAIPSITTSHKNSSQTSSSSQSRLPTVVSSNKNPTVVKGKNPSRRQPVVVSGSSNLHGDHTTTNPVPVIIKSNSDVKEELPETCALSTKIKEPQTFSDLNLETIDKLVEKRTCKPKSQTKIAKSTTAASTVASTSESTKRKAHKGKTSSVKKKLALDSHLSGGSSSEYDSDNGSEPGNYSDTLTGASEKAKAKGKSKAKSSNRQVLRKKPKEKGTQDVGEKAEGSKINEAQKLKKKSKGKGAAISIGVPSNDSGTQNNEEIKPAKRDKRRKEEPNADDLQTLDDIRTDPARSDYLDRPISDFTRDLQTGVVSKAFKEFEQQRQAKKRKLEERKNLTGAALEEAERKDREEEERKKKLEEVKKAAQQKKISDGPVLEETSNAPQVRLVNGKIVLDTDSLVIDRGAEVEENDYTAMEVVEENSMSRKVNSHTYGKRTRSQRWSVAETEVFFDALEQFGTDFQMVSTLLPGRTRNNVRLKFNREERANPKKITEYLLRKRKPMDLEKYKAALGEEFEEVPEDFHSIKLS